VSVRQKSKELERTYTNLEARLGRSATDAEVAKELGISLQDFANLLREVAASTIISLDDFIPGEDSDNRKKRIVDMLEDENAGDALELLQLGEVKELLAQTIARLPEKEKIVVGLYYYEGLTLKEIGAVLSLSESRISQLHTKAIMRMRGSLSKRKHLVT